MDGAALLEEYRKRGTAEGHQGELMSVLAPLLSSTERPKTTYAGHRVTGDCPSLDAFAVNEVRLLLNALAYNLMHAVRALTEKATGEGWGLAHFRERMLKVAARILVHGRRATFVISRSAAHLWQALWQQIAHLNWAAAGGQGPPHPHPASRDTHETESIPQGKGDVSPADARPHRRLHCFHYAGGCSLGCE